MLNPDNGFEDIFEPDIYTEGKESSVLYNILNRFNNLLSKESEKSHRKSQKVNEKVINRVIRAKENHEQKKSEKEILSSLNSSLDKGNIIIREVIKGVDIPTTVIDEYRIDLTNKQKAVDDYIENSKKSDSPSRFENIMSAAGYMRMNNILKQSEMRIRDDARKVYTNKNEMDKQVFNKAISVISSLTNMIKSYSRL